MESHEQDLRDEIEDDAEVRVIQEDYREAKLDTATVHLLDFATKLTLSPKGMSAADIEGLRASGFPDEDVVEAVQLIGYFNYINRVLDALGAEPEPDMRYGRG